MFFFIICSFDHKLQHTIAGWYFWKLGSSTSEASTSVFSLALVAKDSWLGRLKRRLPWVVAGQRGALCIWALGSQTCQDLQLLGEGHWYIEVVLLTPFGKPARSLVPALGSECWSDSIPISFTILSNPFRPKLRISALNFSSYPEFVKSCMKLSRCLFAAQLNSLLRRHS